MSNLADAIRGLAFKKAAPAGGASVSAAAETDSGQGSQVDNPYLAAQKARFDGKVLDQFAHRDDGALTAVAGLYAHDSRVSLPP